MPLETVLISLLSDEVTPAEVDGITVRVFNTMGGLVTEGVTGDSLVGAVEFTLDGDDPATEYDLRFGTVGYAIPAPQRIEVYSPPAASPDGANDYTITAGVLELPQSPNARLCRASGYVLAPDGRPKRGIDMDFVYCQSPISIEGKGVLGERVSTKSGADGFISIDLVRGAQYRVTVESHEDHGRLIEVPDRGSVNIFNLIWPSVETINFDPPGPWALDVEDQLVLTPEVITSSFLVSSSTAYDDVEYTIEDPTIANVSVGADTITITALAVGTTSLVLTRKETSIQRLPEPGINGGDLVITIA